MALPSAGLEPVPPVPELELGQNSGRVLPHGFQSDWNQQSPAGWTELGVALVGEIGPLLEGGQRPGDWENRPPQTVGIP